MSAIDDLKARLHSWESCGLEAVANDAIAEIERLERERAINLEVISDLSAIIKDGISLNKKKGGTVKSSGQVMYEGYVKSAADYGPSESYPTWEKLQEIAKQEFERIARLADELRGSESAV